MRLVFLISLILIESLLLSLSASAQAPSIIAVSPEQNAINVSIESSISFTFDTDMDPATINNNTVFVYCSAIGRISGLISYDMSSKTATFDPEDSLKAGQKVTIVLTTEIKSSGGEFLPKYYTWSYSLEVASAKGLTQFVNYPQIYYYEGVTFSAICSGDFNGDGKPDCAAAKDNSTEIVIILNVGDATFEYSTEYTLDYIPTAIVSADFDGDYDLDLAIAHGNEYLISIFLNNGDGTFGPSSIFTVTAGDNPNSIQTAELNGDGYIDIIATQEGSSYIRILLNNGDGTFPSHYFFLAGNSTHSACAADFDSDGDNDIAVTRSGTENSLTVLLNDGSGVLYDKYDYFAEQDPQMIAAADLDNDNDIDVVVTNPYITSVSILRNYGNGTFAYPDTITVTGIPNAIAAADINGDLYNDIVVLCKFGENLSIIYNNGYGSFLIPEEKTGFVFPEYFCVNDFDGNGTMDICIAQRYDFPFTAMFGCLSPLSVNTIPPQNDMAADVESDISIQFPFEIDIQSIADSIIKVYGSYHGYYYGDYYYDPTTRTLTFNPYENFSAGEIVTVSFTHEFRRSNGWVIDGYCWSFTCSADGGGHIGEPLHYIIDTDPMTLISAHLNADNYLDIAVVDNEGFAWVFTNNGDGTFSLHAQIFVKEGTLASVKCADYDGDGDMDMVTANCHSNSFSILFNNGNGTFSVPVQYESGLNLVHIVNLDMDIDGDLDILAFCIDQQDVLLYKNDGTGVFTNVGGLPGLSLNTGLITFQTSVADLNNDGFMDLAVPGFLDDNVWVAYYGYYRLLLYFNEPQSYAVNSEPIAIFSTDMNGDYVNDMITANWGSGNLSILYGYGDETFAEPIYYPAANSPYNIIAVDINGDKDQDVIVSNIHEMSVYRNNGSGVLMMRVDYSNYGIAGPISTGDYNNDGMMDLALANGVDGNIAVYLNAEPNQCGDINGDDMINLLDIVFLISYLYKGGAAPDDICMSDVNGDGVINILDITYLIAALYGGGSDPECIS